MILKSYVPKYESCTDKQIELLQNFLDISKKFAVITGAGISTESGLPDYRSKDVGLYARNGYRPMNYQEFLNKHSSRQRYWARSFIGWNYVHSRQPNIGHLTLTKWQQKLKNQKFNLIITQNIDRLHHKAGSEHVIELHGNLYNVKCISCKNRMSRISFQTLLAELNSKLIDESISDLLANPEKQHTIRPDGDVDVITDYFIKNFQYPSCSRCSSGILKPDIVFFGDNVDKSLVEYTYEQLNDCDSLLVLGSSLKVFSIYRFILHHLDKSNHQNRLAIVNIGPTRADSLNNENILKINAKISDILTRIQI